MTDPRGGGSRNNTLLIGGIAVGLVAILAVVAIFLTRGDDDGSGDGASGEAVQEQGPVEVGGAALPPYPQVQGFVAPADQDPAVGQTPPTLTGEGFDGQRVVIDPADGTPKVVVFVAHWCPHCQAEVPVLQNWIDEGNLPDGVEVHTVSTAVTQDRPNYPPSAWLDREGWTSPVLLDDPDATASTAWGLRSFPYLVFIDSDGKVTARATGELPPELFGELVDEIAP